MLLGWPWRSVLLLGTDATPSPPFLKGKCFHEFVPIYFQLKMVSPIYFTLIYVRIIHTYSQKYTSNVINNTIVEKSFRFL